MKSSLSSGLYAVARRQKSFANADVDICLSIAISRKGVAQVCEQECVGQKGCPKGTSQIVPETDPFQNIYHLLTAKTTQT